MKTEKVLEAMDYIDPALIEEVGEEETRKRRLPVLVRVGVIAACLCLMLTGTAVAAEQIFGVSIKEFISETYGEHTIGGVDLSITGIIAWPQEQFGRQMVQDLRDEDGKIVLEPKAEFKTWSEAKTYTNLPLADNALIDEGRRAWETYRLRIFNKKDIVYNGQLSCVSHVDDVQVILDVVFYGETGRVSGAGDWGYRYAGEDFVIKNEDYEMPCGARALVMFTDLDGRFGCDALFVQDGILYRLGFHNGGKAIDRAMVCKVLDAFEVS